VDALDVFPPSPENDPPVAAGCEVLLLPPVPKPANSPPVAGAVVFASPSPENKPPAPPAVVVVVPKSEPPELVVDVPPKFEKSDGPLGALDCWLF